MRPYSVRPAASLKGRVSLPGDKSIACRAVIIGSISKGRVVIENFPLSKDCLSAINVFRNLGVRIRQKNIHRNKLRRALITILAKGLRSLCPSGNAIFCGESGTTLRLSLGVLAGQAFKATLAAGASLSQRPMRRVTGPLRLMGANIQAAKHKTPAGNREEYPPITIKGGALKAITYEMPVASAQVKSAIILAGLYAKGRTRVIEPVPTRDHTERMLKLFKAGIKTAKGVITINGGRELVPPKKIYIPGDISSAGFFMVLAAILPDAKIRIEKVSLNPSRTGIVRILRRMGADMRVIRYPPAAGDFEPMGDIIVRSSNLCGTVVKKEEIPSLIDELPILMVAACFANGKTVLRCVEELRVKETDRINSMVTNLAKMGAKIKVVKSAGCEDIVIEGQSLLYGAKVKSFGDHRTAMSMIIAGLKADGKTALDDISCIDKSFPDFMDILHSLVR